MEEPIELMQRGPRRERSAESSASERTFIERKIKPGDTLNKIALQYSVNVAELKRMNNLLSDQDFLARSSIKIPMSRLRHALRLGIESESDEDNGERIVIDEHEKLLNSPRESNVEHLFNKTDATIAQVREALGDDNSSSGSFHFVDAQPPKPTHTPIWLLLLAVVFVFVVLPLFVTVYEETEEINHGSQAPHSAPHK